MRDFNEVRSALGLRKFLDSTMGTLYFSPAAQGADRVLVRHFDSAASSDLTAVYADLIQAVADWVDAAPDVARYVRVERPLEVGSDFIMRPYPIYYVSTDAYDYSDEAPQPPPELYEMRKSVRAAVTGKVTGLNPDENAVIGRVVGASLLEPTGRTYFNEADDLFVVVEPKIDAADVLDWASARPCGCRTSHPHR
jgi:hypothetical protein